MAPRTYSVYEDADTVLVTTAETVVATLPGVTTDRPGQDVRIEANVTITTGAGTTGLTIRVRRDSLTGAQVGSVNLVQVEAAAGLTEDHDYQTKDPVAGEIAGQTYVLTVQQTGATGNGTALRGVLKADIS